jgi:hypothetical protein
MFHTIEFQNISWIGKVLLGLKNENPTFGLSPRAINRYPLEYLEVFDAASATGLKQRQFIDQSVLLALNVLLLEFETQRT